MLSSNTEIYFLVFIFPSTGVSIPTPYYDMHPKNITDARHVVSQSSRRPVRHISDVILHRPFSRHKFCDFDQVLSLSHHWKLYATTDLLSSAISGDKIKPASGGWLEKLWFSWTLL
jgi:hypothetical protein